MGPLFALSYITNSEPGGITWKHTWRMSLSCLTSLLGSPLCSWPPHLPHTLSTQNAVGSPSSVISHRVLPGSLCSAFQLTPGRQAFALLLFPLPWLIFWCPSCVKPLPPPLLGENLFYPSWKKILFSILKKKTNRNHVFIDGRMPLIIIYLQAHHLLIDISFLIAHLSASVLGIWSALMRRHRWLILCLHWNLTI